ncbi:hypothetical protein HK102_013109, partial [Quaeritorhiza haematococci]
VVQFQYNDRSDTLFKSKEAFVVELLSALPYAFPVEPLLAITQGKTFMGGNRDVFLSAALSKPIFCSGNDLYVEVQGVRLALIRKLLMLQPEGSPASSATDNLKIFTETVSEKSYREKAFVYDPGEDRSNMISVQIPADSLVFPDSQSYVRTIRNTALAEVVCFVAVSLNMGFFAKELTVELPVVICHPASEKPPPSSNITSNVFPNQVPQVYDPEQEEALTSKVEGRGYKKAPHRPIPPLPSPPLPPPRRARSHSPQPRPVNAKPQPNRTKQGNRVLPWSDDEDEVEDYRQMASPSRSPAEPEPVAEIPQMFTATAGRSDPVAYVPATERNKSLARSSKIFLDEAYSVYSFKATEKKDRILAMDLFAILNEFNENKPEPESKGAIGGLVGRSTDNHDDRRGGGGGSDHRQPRQPKPVEKDEAPPRPPSKHYNHHHTSSKSAAVHPTPSSNPPRAPSNSNSKNVPLVLPQHRPTSPPIQPRPKNYRLVTKNN